MTEIEASQPDPGYVDQTAVKGVDAGVECSIYLQVAAVVAVSLIRFVFAANRTSYSLSPDEYANAGMARYLSGGRWNMLRTNTWRPGLATILAPFYTLTDHPETLVRLSLAINAVIGGLSILILYRLTRRLTQLSPNACLALSAIVGISPSSLVASAHVWAEPLVTLTFLGCLHSLINLGDHRRLRAGVLAVVWATAGYTAHGRMLPLVAVATLAGGVLLFRAGRRRDAFVVFFGAALLVLLSDVYSKWIYGQIWDLQSDVNSSAGVFRRLRDPLAVVDSLVGQIWYLLAATGLLFGVGVVVIVRRAVGSANLAVRRDSALVLASIAPMIATSVVFMANRSRPDHLFYGRYNEAIIWPILAVGADWALRAIRRRDWRQVAWVAMPCALLLVESGLLVRQLHRKQLRVPSVVDDMIPGLLPYLGASRVVNVFAATLGGLVVAAVLLGAAHIGRRSPVVVVALLAALTGGLAVRTYARLAPAANVYGQSSPVRELDRTVLDPTVPVGIALMPDSLGPAEPIAFQTSYALVYEWYLPDYTFVVDGGLNDDIGPFVFAPVNDLILTEGGGTVVWRDPVAGIALWKEP